MSNHDEEWENILIRAKSFDEYDRLAALTRSVFYFEIALVALGTKRKGREGVTALLNKSRLLSDFDSGRINKIREIIQTRNNAVHESKIPHPTDCGIMVKELFEVWCWMRHEFVNQKTASKLAMELLKADIFYKAFLFGSLTRNVSEPGDIDLLLFDNGEISYMGDTSYREFRNAKNRLVLDRAGIQAKDYYAALDLDWLDIVVVHHQEIVESPEYVRSIASTQRPYFLLNISERIKELDKDTGEWRDSNHLPFERWQSLRKQLENEGIVSEQ